MANKQESSGLGVGVMTATALAAAAAGAYWLYGAKHSAKHRKMAKSFMLKARAEVMDAVEKAKELDKTAYLAIVDKVVAKYSTVSGVTTEEVAHMTKDLKAAWMHLQAAQAKVLGAKKKPAKKAAKK